MHIKNWLMPKRMGVAAFGSKNNSAVGTQNKATRVEWLKHTLAQIPPGSRILDAGAGERKFKKFCSHLNYVAQDFAQYDGTGDEVGLQTGTWDQSKLDIICDITAIPEPDESFDAIMCIEVLEHLPDPIKALKELTRLLKPGGSLILTAPFCSLTHFAPYFFHTGYSRYFYEQWLPVLGYTIGELQFNGNYFEYLAQELHRLPSIGRQYTGIHITYIQTLAIHVLLKVLQRLSHHDTGSHEFLSFGLHVLAQKTATVR